MSGHRHASPSAPAGPDSSEVAAPATSPNDPSNAAISAGIPAAAGGATPVLDAVAGRGNRGHHDTPQAVDPGGNGLLTPLPATDTTGNSTPAAPLPATLDAAALATASSAAVAAAPADLASYAATAIPLIVGNAARMNVQNYNQVAYLLATAEHESKFGKPNFSRSESLVEDHNPYTQGRRGTWSSTVHTNGATVTGATESALDQHYWDSAYGGELGNAKGTADAANFRGRGFVQLTGRRNYEDMSRRLNNQGFSYTIDGVTYGGRGNPAIDLAAHPDHVNRNEDLAARILVLGATQGTFTGVSLDASINDRETDFYDARSVINGDKSENGQSIATRATRYATALSPVWAAVFRPASAAPAGTAPAARPIT